MEGTRMLIKLQLSTPHLRRRWQHKNAPQESQLYAVSFHEGRVMTMTIRMKCERPQERALSVAGIELGSLAV